MKDTVNRNIPPYQRGIKGDVNLCHSIFVNRYSLIVVRSLLTLIIVFSIINYAPAQLKLSDCYKLAEDNYPNKKNIEYQQKAAKLRVLNLNAKYYPDVSLFGQAQYQSDVTKIDLNIPLPNIKLPVIPNDQYKIGLNVNQLIWDGGIISNQKDIEETQGKIDEKNIEVEIYQLHQKVNDSYFNILLMQEKQKSLELAKSTLQSQLNKIESLVRNGVTLESNSYILKAELIKIEQNIDDVKSANNTSKQILSELIGKSVDDKTNLDVPDSDIKTYDINIRKRPEYELFDLTKNNLRTAESLTDSKYLPKLSAYGQAAYAKPGLNMFDPEFKAFYILGISANWKFWNWSTPEREIELLRVQNEILSNQESNFTKNLSIASKLYLNNIDKIQSQLDKDKEIIDLRKKIVGQASSQLENGVITATEFVNEFNAETDAKLNMDRRKLELIQAKVNFITLVGGDK